MHRFALVGALVLVAGCGSGGAKSHAARSTTTAPVASASTGAAPAQGPGAGTSPVASTAPGPSSSGASRYAPAWSTLPPARTISLARDPARTDAQNGAALWTAMQALRPGDRLEVGAGTWSIDRYTDLTCSGTATAPIMIAAAPGARPVITRLDATQNLLNVGVSAPVRYLALQGLELTGGSAVVRLYQASQVWIDRCHLHHCGDAALTANTADTDHLVITRNEIHDTDGTAEGMYLGANSGAHIMSESVIALNHVHDTRGTQGDGIEVKQGSWGNLIAENLIHDTNYPCITVYGTGGRARNVIERNVCYRSGDNTLQVQGEAIVRNNLLMAAAGAGFHCHDHQGLTLDLTVVHNTIVTSGRGMDLVSWNNRANMVLANNAIYSQSGDAVTFPGGSVGVVVSGNVLLGRTTGYAGPGLAPAVGLADFVGIAWDATRRDATPAAGSPLRGAAAAAFAAQDDLSGAARGAPFDAGCVETP